MFASLGNRADVSTNDLLECWEQDERTAAVVLYVESFGNPERFTRIARRVSRRKPILVVKGRRRAERVLSEARSHTAAALRGDAVVDALLASSRGAAIPQRRGAVRRRRVLRAPAAAERTADRDREQLRGCGDARRRRLRDARAGGERGERSAEPADPGDQRRTGRIPPRASASCSAMPLSMR